MNHFFSFTKVTLFISASLLFFTSSCGSNSKNGSKDSEKVEGNITISGAFALYPLVNVWAEEFRKQYPDVKFNI